MYTANIVQGIIVNIVILDSFLPCQVTPAIWHTHHGNTRNSVIISMKNLEPSIWLDATLHILAGTWEFYSKHGNHARKLENKSYQQRRIPSRNKNGMFSSRCSRSSEQAVQFNKNVYGKFYDETQNTNLNVTVHIITQ